MVQLLTNPIKQVKSIFGRGKNSQPQVNAPKYSPELQAIFDQLIGGTKGEGISKGLARRQGLAAGDQSAFAEMEAPAYRQFNQQLGQIGSRFAGSGGLNSSAFQNATGQEASNFAQELQANRHAISEDSLDSLLGLYDRMLDRGTYKPKQSKWGELLGGLSSGFSSAAGGALSGALFGGPAGAIAGGAGGALSRLFGGGR